MHELRKMIDTTWKWAKENKKIITSNIHGAETVSLPVDIFKKSTETEVQSLTMQAHGEVEDPGGTHASMSRFLSRCMRAHLHGHVHVRMHTYLHMQTEKPLSGRFRFYLGLYGGGGAQQQQQGWQQRAGCRCAAESWRLCFSFLCMGAFMHVCMHVCITHTWLVICLHAFLLYMHLHLEDEGTG